MIGMSDFEKDIFGGQAYFMRRYFEEDGEMHPKVGFLVVRNGMSPTVFGAFFDPETGLPEKVSGDFSRVHGKVEMKFESLEVSKNFKYGLVKEKSPRRIEGSYRGQRVTLDEQRMYRGRSLVKMVLDKIEEK